MKSNNALVILTPGFPKDEQDFLCIPPLQDYLISLLKLSNIPEIIVIAFQYPFQRGIYNWHGIQVHAMGGRNKKFPIKLLTWKRAKNTFRKIQTEKKVIAIHSFWLNECAWVGQSLSRKYGIFHFCTAMGQDVLPSNKYLSRLDLSSMKIAAISDRSASDLKRSTGRTADMTIPWGLNPADIQAALDQQGERKYDILGVGSFSKLKAFDEFVEVVRKLRKEIPALKAILIGYGPELEKLQRLIRDYQLNDVVEIKGITPRKEIFSLMSNCKVLLHPSHYESFGMVFLEALAHGMTIVSRPVGIAEESEGWKIAESEESFFNETLKLLKNQEPLPQAAIFSSRDTANSYLNFFEIS